MKRNIHGRKRKMAALVKSRISFLLVIALCLSMVVGFTTTGFAQDNKLDVDTDEIQSTLSSEAADDTVSETETVYHDVFFYDAEGNEFQHAQVSDKAMLTVPAASPEPPEGTAFIGWFEENAIEAYPFSETPVTAELKLYARFEADTREEPQVAPAAESFAAADEDTAAASAFTVQLFGAAAPLTASNTCTVTYMVNGKVYKTDEVERDTLADLSAPTGVSSSQPFLGWYIDGESVPFSAKRLVESNITLHAKFSTNVLVTYLDADGSELEVFEIAKGAKAPSTEKVPTVDTGYEFLYWTLKGSDTRYSFTSAVTSSITLVPKTAKVAVAIFVTQGTEIKSQTGAMGFTAKRPENDPERMGYTFAGWYTDETYETEFTFDDTMPITGAVFIYAKWDAGTANYIVNFWAEKVNTDAKDPRMDTNRADYDLLYTGTVESGEIDKLTWFEEDTAAAEWQANASASAQEILYYSTFEYSEQKEISPFGDTVINVFYKRTAFTFTFDVSAVQDTLVKSSAASGNTLQAKIFLRDGTTVESPYSIDIKLGQDISAIWPYRVEITQYNDNTSTPYYMTNWSGYYGNGAATVSLGFLTVGISANQPVDRSVPVTTYNYTAGTPQRNGVTLYPNVATNPYFETRYYYTEISEERYNELLISNPDSVRVWETDHAVYGGERYYELAREGSVTAQTTNPSKIITSATNENKGLVTATGWPGAAIDGYETIGSTSASVCRTKDFQALSLDEDRNELNDTDRYYRIEYYMPRKPFDLTLVMNNGSITNPSDSLTAGSNRYTACVPYGQDLSAILPGDEQVTRAKYTFDGWYTDSDFNVKYTGETMPANSLTLYAKFTGTEVTVRYSDGTDIVSHSYARDEVLTSHNLFGTPYANVKKNDPVPGKGVFQGWYYEASSGRQVEFPLGMTLTQNEYVLTASFAPATYSVTFMQDSADENYTKYTSQDVQSGARNTLAKSGNQSIKLNLAGYTFMGWSTTAGSDTADFSAATSITHNMTVYPVWQINNYKVTYNAGTPTGALSNVTSMPEALESTHVYKSQVTVAAAPALKGYTFTGWKSSVGGAVYNTSGTGQFTMPAQNVTLTAQWKANIYKVTYNQNGGNTQASPAAQIVTVPAQSVGTLPTAPTRTGYVFSGWNTKADGTGSPFTGATKVSADITVYAQWTQVSPMSSYNLSFDLNGGTGTAPQTQSLQCNCKATVIENPEWPEHTFLGWGREQSCENYWCFDTDTMPAHDVTLYAQWAEETEPATPAPVTPDTPPTPDDPGSAPEPTPDTPDTSDVDPAPATPQRSTTPVTPAVQAEAPATESAAQVDALQPEASTAPAVTQDNSSASNEDGDASAAAGLAMPVYGGGGGPQSPAEVWQQLLDGEIPLFGWEDTATWALLNLILATSGTILGIVILIAAIVRKHRKKRRDENQQESEAAEEAKKQKRVRLVWLVAGISLGVAGVIAFLLTEDMRNAVAWMDKWTLVMAIIFVAEVICSIFSSKRKKKSDQQEKKDASGGAYGVHQLG